MPFRHDTSGSPEMALSAAARRQQQAERPGATSVGDIDKFYGNLRAAAYRHDTYSTLISV